MGGAERRDRHRVPAHLGCVRRDGSVTFTVNRQGALPAKRTIAITDGVAVGSDFDLHVREDDRIFFHFSVYDPDLNSKISGASVQAAEPRSRRMRCQGRCPAPRSRACCQRSYRDRTYAGRNSNRDQASPSPRAT